MDVRVCSGGSGVVSGKSSLPVPRPSSLSSSMLSPAFLLWYIAAFLDLSAASSAAQPQAKTSVLASNAALKAASMNILNSETLPGNLLPNFMFQQGSIEGGSVGVKIGGGRGTAKPFTPDDSCGDDIWEGAMEDMRSPQLPYLTQDLWTCDRKPEDIPVWLLEDEDLKVTITPQYDGKVWAIYDKKRGKELLYNNRAHQPANIGALKSWAAGGAEWNWSPGIIGHSAFSETQVFMARVDSAKGPVARVYEFDRYNGTVWQVDMLVANSTFFAHPRITNPTDVDLRGYWWTCVAVDAFPSTRIYAPATHVAETSRDPMRDAPWPFFAEAIENSTFKGYQDVWMTDNSYLGNHQIGDMFLRIPDTVYTPYIGHNQVDDEGFVYIHGHPLNGTKFYTWGDSGPGRFMQDFLAGGGKRQGDYTELQVGPAPTQMQNFPVPKQSVLQWTEWFKGFQGKQDILRGDYDAAIKHVDEMIQARDGMPKDLIQEMDSFFEHVSTQEPSEILVQGQPWGALEEMLLGKPLAPGIRFTMPEKGTLGYKEAQPWLELLQGKQFSEETLGKLPLSYQTTDRWLRVLEESVKVQGMTWLHALHLGVAYTERGFISEPKEYFSQSMKLRPNPLAERNLGVLSSTPEEAWPHFQKAWQLLHSDFTKDTDAYERMTLNMITEISFFLQQQLWYDEMKVFIEDVLSHNYLAKYEVDAFITMHIKYLMHTNDFSAAREMLGSHCFPTYAKARDDLMNMWNAASEGIAAQKKGTALTRVEAHQVRTQNPVPDNIGCQYASKYCTNYW
jgi:hypothetical protein